MTNETSVWLTEFIQAGGGVAGTVHLRENDELVLSAAHNIPPRVLKQVDRIPRGKGMAGLAFERNDVVNTCNLQTDKSGDVQPGAKAVKALAVIAIPVHAADGEIRAIVGIAYAEQRDISGDELEGIVTAAKTLP